MPEKLPVWKRVLRFILTALLSIALITVFYVAVVIGQPQPNAEADASPLPEQPLLSPLPAAIRITSEADFALLSELFPARIIRPQYGDALIFVEGVCSDAAYEGGLGRIVTLTYRTADFSTVTLSSIYPARAIDLMGKGDYRFSSMPVQTVAQLRAVPMENSTTLRLHAQSSDALYVLTFPRVATDVLRTWITPLQLFSGE